jgi:ABC-type cobalamin/Fe3+-siderophores transport system ATPase subunit
MPLQVENLTAGYGKRGVLQGVSLTLNVGEVVALIGPNGSGKSTLLRCIARAIKYDTGTLTIDGENLSAMNARAVARKITFVPQENPMPYAFTVAELVGLGSVGQGTNAQREAMELLDLLPLANRSVVGLSGGERQRAALARGLAQETPYLLLDEPTAHLDLKHQQSLLNVARERAQSQKTGVLVVLHDLNLAAASADTLCLMHKGEIVASGAPSDVLTPEILHTYYQTNVFITADERNGRPLVHPL